MKDVGFKQWERVGPVLRALGVMGAVAWGWYIVALFRTTHFGFAPATLGLAALFVLPVAALVWLGTRRTTFLVGVMLVLFVSFLTAEGLAALEELHFQRRFEHLPPEALPVIQERSWPFDHHYLYYLPDTRSWGGGD